jgi:hypothetical protein
VRIRQYAYFALMSSVVSAAEISDRLGMAPDEVRIRGGRTAEPPRPISHAWMVVCRERGIPVDELVSRIVARLRGHQKQIATLSRALVVGDPAHGHAVLQVVRYFGADDGEEEEFSPPTATLQKLAGQHQLLGWALEPAVLEFLVMTNASVDVDEYG